MKKWLFIVFCVTVVAMLGILVSCSSDGAVYYVRFSADGQSYEFTKGYTDIENGDAVALISVDTYLLITGTTDNVSSDAIGNPEADVQNVVWVVLNGTTVGTYDEEGEIETAYIALNGVAYVPSALSVTVSVINEEGSTIEGTFTATLTPEAGGEDVVITDGEFKLYRAADNSILPPV